MADLQREPLTERIAACKLAMETLVAASQGADVLMRGGWVGEQARRIAAEIDRLLGLQNQDAPPEGPAKDDPRDYEIVDERPWQKAFAIKSEDGLDLDSVRGTENKARESLAMMLMGAQMAIIKNEVVGKAINATASQIAAGNDSVLPWMESLRVVPVEVREAGDA